MEKLNYQYVPEVLIKWNEIDYMNYFHLKKRHHEFFVKKYPRLVFINHSEQTVYDWKQAKNLT